MKRPRRSKAAGPALRILITAGATREPVDAVRFLSNVSTGGTGAALAAALAARGHSVALLHGEGAVLPAAVRDREAFSSAADLRARLRRRLAKGKFDIVVMAAAVADYRPAVAVSGKMDSAPARRLLRLKRNPKILPELKSYAPNPLFVAGFKLTVAASAALRRRAVAAQFAAGGVDTVVHNDLAEIRAAPSRPFRLHRSPRGAGKKIFGAAALAAALVQAAARGAAA